MLKKLSRFDAHTKAQDGVQEKTAGGAAVSVIAGIGGDAQINRMFCRLTRSLSAAIVLLFVSEFSVYRTTEVRLQHPEHWYLYIAHTTRPRPPQVRNHMYVDPAQGSKNISVNLKISFPELPCSDVNLDVEDSKKGQSLHAQAASPYLSTTHH
jgi:hypothetical protein